MIKTNNNHITHSAFSKSPPHLMSLPPLSVALAQQAPKIVWEGLLSTLASAP